MINDVQRAYVLTNYSELRSTARTIQKIKMDDIMRNLDKKEIINQTHEPKEGHLNVLSYKNSNNYPSVLYECVKCENNSSINKAFNLLFEQVFKDNKNSNE